MPYTVRKQPCTQSSGKKGSYTLSYTDKKGKEHKNCHTSEKKAKGQISAIEMSESDDVVPGDTLLQEIMITIMERLLCHRSQT